MKNKIYVGYCRTSLNMEKFSSAFQPTEKEYGEKYFAVIGPFITKRGADFMVKYGRNNPHIQIVSDAERLAKNEAINLERYKVVYTDKFFDKSSDETSEDTLTRKEVDIVIKRENFKYPFKFPKIGKSVSFISDYSDDEIRVTIEITRVQ
jgi:hypothetical protein